jgi:hypothetical protein
MARADAEMPIGTAIYHASRILTAARQDVTALVEKIYRRLIEECPQAGITVGSKEEGAEPKNKKNPHDPCTPNARWLIISLSLKNGNKRTLALVFDFGTEGSPSENMRESLLFVCWLPREPPKKNDEDKWTHRSFVGLDRDSFRRHPSGVEGFASELDNGSVLEKEWAYAVPLSSFSESPAIECIIDRIIVNPLKALLAKQPLMEAFKPIENLLVPIGRDKADSRKT